MKTLFKSLRLIDLGRVSGRTRGVMFGLFTEAGAPPFNHWTP